MSFVTAFVAGAFCGTLAAVFRLAGLVVGSYLLGP